MQLYAVWKDQIAPTVARISTGFAGFGGNNVGMLFTFNIADNSSESLYYYFGDTYPTVNNVTYTASVAGNVQAYLDIGSRDAGVTPGYETSGTYYFAVKDSDGNLTVKTINYAYVFVDDLYTYNNNGVYQYGVAAENSWDTITIKEDIGYWHTLYSFTANSGTDVSSIISSGKNMKILGDVMLFMHD